MPDHWPEHHLPFSLIDELYKKSCMNVIEAEGLNLIFETSDGSVQALSDININIQSEEFVSFIGPSGCGKTTFMRVVADLETPTNGRILVNGMTPHEARVARAYGYVFQAPALYPWRTVEKNIHLPLEIMGIPKEERKRRAEHYLEMVNLAGFAKKFPWQLSGGMQQRVSIARALSFKPELLLMDEPFGALDEITRDHLNDQLFSLWQETGKTVIFITHSITEAVFLSTKIVVMSPRPGRIIKVIESDLASNKDRENIRESKKFLDIAHEVRETLREVSYDE